VKIKSLKISNALSFEHDDDIENCDEISFDNNLSILIGPNGSGKSNFLEIISEIFKKAIFRYCPFTIDEIIRYKNNPSKEHDRTITDYVKPEEHSLSKNINFPEKPLAIKFEIELTDNDIENLIFIQRNADKIQELLHDYYHISIKFEGLTENEIQNMEKNASYLFKQFSEEKFLNVEDLTDDRLRFIFHYLLWFEYIQNCIIISNKIEGTGWPNLKNVFSLLGSSRDYETFEPIVSVEDKDGGKWRSFRTKIMQRTVRGITIEEPIPISEVKYKIAQMYNEIREEIAERLRNANGKTAKQILEEETVFGKLNKILFEHLKVKLDIERPNYSTLDYSFKFIDEHGHEKPIFLFSSGEKGLIQLIFAIFGRDIRHGAMIIDEPEAHIHPQLQQKIIEIMKKAISDLDMQFIVATHSPIFVNKDTIESVYRFYKKNNFTKVIRNQVTVSERDLIQILNYTNSSKIFFVDKVVLVEGDSDEYFFRFYFDYFKNNNTVKEENIEFLYIGGKDRYPVWRDFLKKYEIAAYFIGDLDNVFDIELGIIDQTTLDTLQNDFEILPATIQEMTSNSNYKRGTKQYRKDLLDYVKTNKQNEWQTITSNIVGKYSDRIYILKEGELENYTQSHSKLKGIIQFCKHDFSNWVVDTQHSSKTSELDTIFTEIAM